MRRFWKKQLPAFLLTLIMMISLVPAAMAACEDGHTPGNWEITKEATCTESGLEIQKCTICGAELDSRVISPTGHNYSVTKETAATCEEDGHRTETCSKCGDVLETTLKSTGHDYVWKVDTAATCISDGKRTGTCRVCEDVTSEVIPQSTEHQYGEWSVTEAATCTTKGKQTRTCTVCKIATETKTINALGHDYTWTVDATYHQADCKRSGCGATISKAAHKDSNNDGKCDTCGYTMSTTYPVTFSYLNSSTDTRSSSANVPAGSYVLNYAPSAADDFTYKGTTYTFKGWTTSSYSSYGYIYKNQTLVKSSATISGSINLYAVYTTDEDDSTITYTVDAGKEKAFNSRDFKKLHDAACSDTFEYVTFSVTSSTYNKFTGSVYSGNTELSASDLRSDFYYDEDDAGKNDYALDDLSLVAPKGAKDSSISISFTTYGSKNKTSSGTLKLVVGEDEDDDTIVYEVAPGKTVDFSRTDFNKVYQTKYSGSSFSYVVFDKPGTTAFSEGTLYSGYTSSSKYTEKFTRTNLGDAYFYYSGASGSDSYNINTLTFVADSDFEDTVKLTFTVYGSSSRNYVEGTVEIRSTDSSDDGDVTYTVAAGKEVEFDEDDFQSLYRKEYSSGTIKWVEFTAPTTLTSAGTVYYNYGSSSQKSFTRSTLNSNKFYYGSSSSYGDYALDDLSFVAFSSFSSSVSISFRAYSSDSKYVDGTLVIKSGSSSTSGDITLTVTPGKSVDLDKSKFQSFLRSETGDKKATMDYVRFDRPSSTTVFLDGALYSNYGKSSQVKFTQSNLSGYSFYYDSTDATGTKEYAMDTLSFVADSTFTDSIKLTFTVYGDDDEEEEGTLVIKSDGTTAGVASNYVGSVRYTTTTGTKVQINADDIARFFSKNAYGSTMQYVAITGVPTTGSLYYNYYNTSKYGSASKVQLTAANCGTQTYYASPTAATQYALTELTYVPSGTNYCASIPFTAYGGSRSVSGAILISVNGSAVAEVYGVTPKNTAVTFPASNISKAVSTATGTTPASIQLLSLPSYTAGAVYVGSGTTTLANTSTAYAIFSGAQSLRFVPSTSYTGNVEIPYAALNSNGSAIAVGSFSLGVVSSKKSFTDVKESTWCYKYVAELSSDSIISGYADGSFKPDSTVTYGAALKLVMLAAGYPEQAPTGKNVFSGYLDKARAEGIITRSNVDLTKPITRLQVAQLAAGAMKLNTSNLSTVQPFTDTTDVSVRALNAAGIVGGYFSNGIRTFKPNNTLTRGQVAAIVWRMRNYNK